MRTYHHWLIAVLACLFLLVSNGMTLTGISVFDESILGEFGWDRGQLKFRDMVTLLITGICAPFIGILIDRFGVRKCMMAGWCILIVAYVLYGQLQSLLGLYFIHALMGIVLVSCGLNACVILVSHWFVAKRGTAIGIALVGTSLGGALLPQYGTFMNERMGWRLAMQSEIIFPVLMLLLVLFIMRDRPAERGLQPLGADRVDGTAARTLLTGVEYRVALRTPTFWALALIAMATFYTVLGVQAHLFLYMRDLEFTRATATNAISLFFGCALFGKFIFGFLADYLSRNKVFYGNLAVMLAGAVMLALMRQELLWPAIAAFGLGWGGVYTMIQLSAMNCFGLKAAGKILGTITILDAFGGGLGIWLTGVLYERTGSYDLAFQVFVGLIVLATLAISQVRQVVPGQAQA
jgi:sugar phosphate permease